jgi:histidine ammonia-lyase
MKLGARVSLAGFTAALAGSELAIGAEVLPRLEAARRVVDAAVAGEAPVYGLNTGLGGNLGHRLTPEQIPAFQRQIVEGRAVAVGPLLPPETGRALLLARLVGVAQGHSGLSVAMFDHLCTLWRAGLAPGLPRWGSIGAADLTQNATWAMAVLGQGPVWDGSAWGEASAVFAARGITVPVLQPKDAMALINHSGTSVALAAAGLQAAGTALGMFQQAAVLAFDGFGANADIFVPAINDLRASPGQAAMAAWFAARVQAQPARRVQDALSFRTLAPVMGAARDALERAVAVWEDELNGASDNPVVWEGAAMRSTPNFHAPALALALEQVSLALALVASGSAMRVQRLMNPDLTGLPRYLSPVGGASAGFVPLQKTVGALLGEVRRQAMPVVMDAAPVSDSVEDVAPMTPLAACKLVEQAEPLRLMAGIEGLVAAQARDLRGLEPTELHAAIRSRVPMLQADRPLGGDAEAVAEVLAAAG